jgi:peptide/nickel transport system permease protein
MRWLEQALQGNFGFSFATRSPVSDIIMQRLPQTLQVVGLAYLIAIAIAIPVGIISAVRQYSIFDQVATFFSFVGFSVPSFFTGLILILVFAINLKWFPIVYNTTLEVVSWETFVQQVRQMFLPVTVLVVQQTAALTRFMRSSMLDNLPLDYVRTARAKGLADRVVVLRHVVTNSLIPVVTLIALGIPTIFAGAIITENLFRVNGLGALLITAIQNSDTPVVMALTFIFAILTVTFNLIADVLYGLLDPRVRYG